MISRRALIAGLASLWASVSSAFWQSRDSNYNVAIGGVVASGITRIGTATGTNTATVPAHVAGDLIIIAAGRTTTGTPALPLGFTQVIAKTGTTCSIRVGFKIATSTSDTAGTWTNATALVCHVYRASSGYTIGVGALGSHAQTTNTINYPALTMANSSGTSWVAGFVFVNNLTNTISTAPSGMVNQSLETASGSQAAGHDTNGPVSSWSSTNATTTGTAGDSVSGTVELLLLPLGTAVAQMFQHVGAPANFPADVESLNNCKIRLPNPSGAGNCFVLGFLAPNGSTPSISDDNGNTWPGTATVHVNAGSGNEDLWAYVLPNINAGQTNVEVSFSSAVTSFCYTLTEYSGIATSSPVNGSTSVANTAGPTLSAGNFTPTNNNANGGNLIWYFAGKSAAGGSNAVTNRMVALPAWTLLHAAYESSPTGNPTYSFPSVAAHYVQATSASITPSVSAVADTDPYDMVAIALALSPGAGTAAPSPSAGIRINKVLYLTTHYFPSSTGNYFFQWPSTGNLRVVVSSQLQTNTNTMSDSEGNLWSTDSVTGSFFYLPSSQFDSNLATVYSGTTDDGNVSFKLYDIQGAATSPWDSGGNVVGDAGDIDNQTSFTNLVDPDPTSSNGLVICAIGLGTGPGLGITSPSGSVWTQPNYTGETDSDDLVNADIAGFYHYTAAGAQTWTFTITSEADNAVVSGGFAAFHQ